jgi:hypothetical protein
LAKHVLHNAGEDFNFLLFGLVCLEDQYRTVSLVNDALNIDLQLVHFLPYSLKDGKIFNFSLYGYEDEELYLEFSLIPNTSNFDEPRTNGPDAQDLFSGQTVDETVRLIKELPRTDYFLIVKGEELHHYEFRISEALRGVPGFLQIQTIRPDELQSKRNLLF